MLAVLRAFAVTFGPVLALDLLAARAVRRTVGALARRRRPAGGDALLAAAVVAHVAVGRPWMRGWGAEPRERRTRLPGDELVPGAVLQTTRAVTIDAPTDVVWAWLVQIGQDRGGFYSYAWLENLAGCRLRNADEIRPEWQQRAVGDLVLLHPRHGQRIARLEPERVLALEGWGAWVLEPQPGDRTRLLARGRTRGGAAAVYDVLLVEVPHFVMERRMLLGIKERAERTARERTAADRS